MIDSTAHWWGVFSSATGEMLAAFPSTRLANSFACGPYCASLRGTPMVVTIKGSSSMFLGGVDDCGFAAGALTS